MRCQFRYNSSVFHSSLGIGLRRKHNIRWSFWQLLAMFSANYSYVNYSRSQYNELYQAILSTALAHYPCARWCFIPFKCYVLIGWLEKGCALHAQFCKMSFISSDSKSIAFVGHSFHLPAVVCSWLFWPFALCMGGRSIRDVIVAAAAIPNDQIWLISFQSLRVTYRGFPLQSVCYDFVPDCGVSSAPPIVTDSAQDTKERASTCRF